MDRQHMHANWALLSREQFPERPHIQLGAEIELSSSPINNMFDGSAFLLMLLPVFFLTILVAIPNALAIPTFHEAITLLSACRTHLGWDPVFLGGVLVILGLVLSFYRFTEGHGAELLSSSRCIVLFGRCHGCLVRGISTPYRQIRSRIIVYEHMTSRSRT